jgi:hypothetical protein
MLAIPAAWEAEIRRIKERFVSGVTLWLSQLANCVQCRQN